MPQTLNLRKQQAPEKPELRVRAQKKPPEPLAARLARRPDTVPQENNAHPIAWHSPASYRAHSMGYGTILAAIIAWIAAGWFAWHDQWFAALVLACAGIAALVFRQQAPSHRTVHIHEAGIVIDDTYYAWHDLKSFWIDYHPGSMKELSLEFAQWYRPHLRILLADQDPLAVRQALLTALPERPHPISLIDFWMKRY